MTAKRKIFSLIMSCVMVSSVLYGCAGVTVPAATAGPETEAVTVAEAETETAAAAAEETVPADAEAAGSAAEESSGYAEEDITEINVSLLMGFFNQDDYPEVVEAMNAITEKSIGVRINASFSNMGEYGTQLGLDFASGKQLDVISVTAAPPADFNTLSSNGQLMDLTELLDTEAPETRDLLGDYLSAGSVKGGIYMIPTWRNYAGGTYLTMRTDTLEEIGMLEKAEAMSSWSEFEEILQAVADNTDLSPIAGNQSIISASGSINGKDKFADTINFDYLGDAMSIIFTDDDGNVSLLPENEDYKAQLDRVRNWYNAGLVYKDSLTLTDSNSTVYINDGVVFSGFTPGEFGAAERMTQRIGRDMTTIEITKQATGSSPVVRFGLGIPVTAAEPEAAMRWINALNTDPELENLIIWGIEGKHYVIENGEAIFPEGVDESNTTYHSNDFLYGNFFNCLPWKTQGADFREQAKAYLDDAPISPYLGFTADTSELANTIAALTTAREKYRAALNCGMYTDEDYENYIKDIKAAGADEYVAAYQEQLNAWKAEN